MRSLYCFLLTLLFVSIVGCGGKLPPKDDASARKDFEKIQVKLEKAKTVSLAQTTNESESGLTQETVEYLDPTHFKIADRTSLTVADGESVYITDSADRSYDRYSLSGVNAYGSCELWGFPVAEESSFTDREITYSYIQQGKERILRRHMEADGEIVDVFYSLKTGLPLGFRHEYSGGLGEGYSYEAKYSKIVLDPVLKSDLFVFKAPIGYRFKSDRLENIQFAKGGTFPSAELSFVDSKYSSVEQMARENKAILVIFWSHG